MGILKSYYDNVSFRLYLLQKRESKWILSSWHIYNMDNIHIRQLFENFIRRKFSKMSL